MKRTWADTAEAVPVVPAAHVVVVEAGGRTTSALVALLLARSMTLARVGNAIDAARAALADDPDALLVDAQSNDADACQVCRAVRRVSDAPILVLAADAAVAARIEAAQCGADACIADGAPDGALLVELQALIERRHPRPALWRIDAVAHSAMLGVQALPLTPSEFRLLAALLAVPGRVCSRAELLDRIQLERRDDVCDRAIDIHVRSLRRKIAALRPGSGRIVAVYGAGYRFES